MTLYQSLLLCICFAFFGCFLCAGVCWMRYDWVPTHHAAFTALMCILGMFGSLGGIVHSGPPKPVMYIGGAL